MDRTPRGASPIVRLAFLAQGGYLLVISTVPFLRLLRAGIVDRDLLILQYTLWSVVPAVALLVAAWAIGRPLEPISVRALRGSTTMATGYLALGCLISLADPSTSPTGIATALAVLTTIAVGAVGLARLKPIHLGIAFAPAPQGSVSRSTTTIR